MYKHKYVRIYIFFFFHYFCFLFLLPMKLLVHFCFADLKVKSHFPQKSPSEGETAASSQFPFQPRMANYSQFSCLFGWTKNRWFCFFRFHTDHLPIFFFFWSSLSLPDRSCHSLSLPFFSFFFFWKIMSRAVRRRWLRETPTHTTARTFAEWSTRNADCCWCNPTTVSSADGSASRRSRRCSGLSKTANSNGVRLEIKKKKKKRKNEKKKKKRKKKSSNALRLAIEREKEKKRRRKKRKKTRVFVLNKKKKKERRKKTRFDKRLGLGGGGGGKFWRAAVCYAASRTAQNFERSFKTKNGFLSENGVEVWAIWRRCFGNFTLCKLFWKLFCEMSETSRKRRENRFFKSGRRPEWFDVQKFPGSRAKTKMFSLPENLVFFLEKKKRESSNCRWKQNRKKVEVWSKRLLFSILFESFLHFFETNRHNDKNNNKKPKQRSVCDFQNCSSSTHHNTTDFPTTRSKRSSFFLLCSGGCKTSREHWTAFVVVFCFFLFFWFWVRVWDAPHLRLSFPFSPKFEQISAFCFFLRRLFDHRPIFYHWKVQHSGGRWGKFQMCHFLNLFYFPCRTGETRTWRWAAAAAFFFFFFWQRASRSFLSSTPPVLTLQGKELFGWRRASTTWQRPIGRREGRGGVVVVFSMDKWFRNIDLKRLPFFFFVSFLTIW